MCKPLGAISGMKQSATSRTLTWKFNQPNNVRFCDYQKSSARKDGAREGER